MFEAHLINRRRLCVAKWIIIRHVKDTAATAAAGVKRMKKTERGKKNVVK